MRVSMKVVLKSLGLTVAVALVLAVSVGLLQQPARAQGPKSEPQYIDLNPLATTRKAPQVEEEALPSHEGVPSDPTYASYLRILSLDGFSGRPMPGLAFLVYSRDNAVVAEVTSDCNGVVRLDDLPTGYYNVQARYSEGDPYIAYGGSYSRWVFVGAGRRATVRFYSYPSIRLAGIRVYAYDASTYAYAGGVPFTVYDSSGTQVFSDVTNCSGFVDFFETQPGWYRVVTGADQEPEGGPTPTATTPVTETPPAPFPPGSGFPGYPDPGEKWVLVYPGYLVAVDFYVDSSAYPQTTPTPYPDLTATPGTPAPTVGAPSATPTPTEQAGPPPPPP